MALQVNSLFMVEVPSYGGELREGLVGLPRTINPVLAVTDVDKDISSLVYSGLTRYNKGAIAPDLAKDWKVSADGLTYTFDLKPNLKFQDGTPVTADDVAFTIKKIQDAALKSPRQADWANVSVSVSSPSQIQFVLKQPYSPFLSNTTIGILPKHIWSAISDDQFSFSQYNSSPIGSGPYEVSAIARDSRAITQSYTISTWNGYYAKVPYLSSITFVFYTDEDNALSALDSGIIDSLPSVPAEQASHLASNSAEAYTVLKSPLPRIFGVFFNQNQNPALADKNVRTALDMSIDRPSIVKIALSGYGIPIDGPLPINISQASGVDSGDISAAQTLLEKNGWVKGVDGIYAKTVKKTITSLTFDIYTADTPDLKQTADIVKNAWTRLGANVSVKVFEPSDLYQNIIRTRKYDALLFGEFVGKDQDLYAFWHSSQRNPPGLNVAMYTNSQTDKILESLRTSTDDSSRASMFKQFEDTIRSDIPAIFLYVPDFDYIVPKSLHEVDLEDVTMPSDRFSSISNWYMSTEKVWKIFAR